MKDNLISEFDQVAVMAPLGIQSKAAAKGACHNFTIEWISFMFMSGGSVSGTIPKERMSSLAKNNGAGNPVLQKAFIDFWTEDRDSYKKADTMMIGARGLIEKKMAFDFSAFDQAALEKNITAPDYSGLIYSFWFPGAVRGADGAHTIGFFRSLKSRGGAFVPVENYVSAFDPNFGEYQIPSPDFNNWFNKLKQAYGGNLTSHMLKYVTSAK